VAGASPAAAAGSGLAAATRRDGRPVELRSTPGTVFPSSSQLNGVSCTAPTACWAVGFQGLTDGGNANLVVRWDGRAWSVVAVPQPSGTTTQSNQVLYGVHCVSVSDCWAVGYEADRGGAGRTSNEIEHWDGSVWSVVPAPQPSAISQILYSVTCSATSDCWAVGLAMPRANHPAPEALRWNGKAWSLVSMPGQAPGGETAQSVGCASGALCVAVGFGNTTNGATINAALLWQGTAWATTTPPQPGRAAPGGGPDLQGVACPAATSCWAVGAELPSSWVRLNQVLHWTPSGWRAATVPQPSGSGATGWQELNAISCSAATDCWAVGDVYLLYDQNEALHWDGRHWSVAAPPNPAGHPGQVLQGVSCTRTTDCWAVGVAAIGANRTEALHWDGSRWLAATVPNPR
jgi:hypothetical protein